MISTEDTCKDYGSRPGCLCTPDPAYTMDFTDIDQGKIYFCSHCGPDAHAMATALERALNTRGPAFAEELAAEVDKAKAEAKAKTA